MSSEIRELTIGEKKSIRGLVLNHCANHDSKEFTKVLPKTDRSGL